MKRRSNLWVAFGYAGRGVWYALRQQRNLRIHVSVALLAGLLAWILAIHRMGWAVVILVMALVLSLELMNTGLEALTDLASPQFHPLAGAAKDAAAGAVLVAAAASVAIGWIVYQPQLAHFRQHFMVRWHENPAFVVGFCACVLASLALLWGLVPERQPREGGQRRIGDTP